MPLDQEQMITNVYQQMKKTHLINLLKWEKICRIYNADGVMLYFQINKDMFEVEVETTSVNLVEKLSTKKVKQRQDRNVIILKLEHNSILRKAKVENYMAGVGTNT